MSGMQLGKVFGIPIEINASWLFIFFLLAWSLAEAQFPREVPGLGAAGYWAMGIVATLLCFASLVAHELSHSVVSTRAGMKVKRIVLFIFGGVSESAQEMPTASVELRVAIAGPLMSFAIGLVSWGLSSALATTSPPAAGVLRWLAYWNIAVGVFNLLPGYPLDGGRVLRALVWRSTGSLLKATRIAARVGQAVGGLLVVWAALHLLAGDFIGAIWIGVIGMMLFQAAGGSYADKLVRGALQHVGVADLMSPTPVTLSPDTSVREVVEAYASRLPYGGYPVADGTVEGVLQTASLRKLPPEAWDRTHVRDVMTPLAPDQALTPGEPVSEALEQLERLELGRLPVVDARGAVVGVLSKSDVVRWIIWHTEALEGAGKDE